MPKIAGAPQAAMAFALENLSIFDSNFAVATADNTPKTSCCSLSCWSSACAEFTFAQMSAPAKTPGEALIGSLGIVEHEFVSAADAMPEDKFSFAPTDEFKGVRTFAQQVKHVAAANYFFGSLVLAEKPPLELGGENGPDSLKSKSEIIKFLNECFAYLHKALAAVSDKNEFEQIDSPMGMKVPPLSLAAFSLPHPMDHYGQIVEYLRMNGIVPPPSRSQNR